MIVRKRNISTQFEFELVESGSSNFKSGITFTAGEIKISKDGGNFANSNNLPSEVNTPSGIYKILLTAEETNADRICIKIVDSEPKAWHDTVLWVDTVSITAVGIFAQGG